MTRVNPHTNAVIEAVKVGPKPGRLAVGEGGVWTLNRGNGSVSRIDPKTNKVVATIPVDGAAVLVAHGSVWVTAAPGVTWRLDPKLVAAMRPE